MDAKQLLHTLRVHSNPIGASTGFTFVHELEKYLATARADAMEEAARVAADGALNAGDTSEMRMAQAIADAIRALALKPEGRGWPNGRPDYGRIAKHPDGYTDDEWAVIAAASHERAKDLPDD